MAESVVEESRGPSAGQRPKRRTRMSSKRKAVLDGEEESNKRRAFNNFYTFCSFVLEYEEKLASESTNQLPLSPVATSHAALHSPINSAGESSSSPSSSESSSGGSEGSDAGGEGLESPDMDAEEGGQVEYTSDDESWNLVTCFCRRPFAGRPMIECSKCETWIHLFCAKIRKGHVPEIYVCPSCTKAS